LQTSALPLGYAALPVSIKNKSGKMKQYLLENPRAFVLHPPAFIYFVERETRFELATLALARRCSTTELLPL
jgi:hypothetical protein